MPVNVQVRTAVREGKALAAAGRLDEAEAVLIRLTHEPVGSPEDRAAVADLLTAIAAAHGVDAETFLQKVFLQKVDEATTLARTDPEAGLRALDAILASADPERSTQRLAIADALYNRAALLRQFGRREEAIRDYRKTVALFAGDADPDVQFWVALALVNHAQYLLAEEAPHGERDVPEGLRLLEQLMTDFRDSAHPQIRERLARGALFRVSALTELGRQQEASAVLAEALRMLSGDPAELRAPLEEFRDTFLPAEGLLTEQALKLGGREWACVLAAALGQEMLEQWCPRGELPSRATVLLSRTRWQGELGTTPAEFVQLAAAETAEGSPVRPTLRLLHADDQTAGGLLTFENDVLMGDHWQVQLVHRGRTVSVTCTVEADGSAPASVEPEVRLAAALVSAPDGVPTRYTGPTADAVQAAASRLELHVAEDTLDADVEAVHRVVRSAEALPLTPAANYCLAQLATRLAGAPGADFFGFAEESLRVFRILLKRTNRRADSLNWAFYARGALLARAQLAAPDDLTKLVAACEGALKAPLLDHHDPRAGCLEQAILWHTAGELLVRVGDQLASAGDRAPYERAVTACTRSYEAARELGSGFESFAYTALECRARAQHRLGADAEERATLAEALQLAPASHRDQIEARLRELAASRPASATPTWGAAVEALYKDSVVDATHGQMRDRVIHPSPLRRRVSDSQILVLRPLVTALAPTLPNRFVVPFRHAWRFQDEPPTMTFEETLSRALGHRFAFAAIGADFEALGVGRIESFDPNGPEDPEAWKQKVEVMTRDPLMCRIVLVHPSDSPGMQWELDLLASTSCKGQARFFLIPPHVDADIGRSAWDRARRALEARHLGVPAWDPVGLVFRHDARGAVAMCDTFEAVWDGRFAGWLETCANAPEKR